MMNTEKGIKKTMLGYFENGKFIVTHETDYEDSIDDIKKCDIPNNPFEKFVFEPSQLERDLKKSESQKKWFFWLMVLFFFLWLILLIKTI